MTLYVNVYNVAQAYGGPEEGGWWFNTGIPVGSIPVELTDEERDKLHDEYVSTYKTENDLDTYSEWFEQALENKAWTIRDQWKERYPFDSSKYSSVLSYQYENYEVLVEDHFAEAYPEERPHYE